MQRRITTYGLLTVGCAALTTACGEDDNSLRMTLGMGGTSSTGNGGTGNTTSGMGGGAQTGMGGGASGGLPAICSDGCVELNVPIPAGAADAAAMVYRQAQFLFRPGTNTDMSTTVVTWRVKAAISTAGIPAAEMYVAPFAQNGSALMYSGLYGAQIPLTPENAFLDDDTWVNIVMDIPNAGISTGTDNTPDAGAVVADGGVDGGDGGTAAPADPAPQASTLDATQVFQWGLYVGAIGTSAGTVRIAVDSVDYEGGTNPVIPDVSFVQNAESFQLDNYQVPTGAALVHRL